MRSKTELSKNCHYARTRQRVKQFDIFWNSNSLEALQVSDNAHCSRSRHSSTLGWYSRV